MAEVIDFTKARKRFIQKGKLKSKVPSQNKSCETVAFLKAELGKKLDEMMALLISVPDHH